MSKTNFINKSYKDKLRATYTLLVFMLLILLSVFLYFQMNTYVKPIIRDIGSHVVDSQAQYLGERFHNQNKMLEILASTETFKSGDIDAIKQELDNQMLKDGNLILSIKYKSITGEEYENNPYNINSSDVYEKDLLTGNSPKAKTQAIFNETLGEYIVFTGAKITDNTGTVNGVLLINVGVKEVANSLSKTKMGLVNELWIFDSLGNAIVNPNEEQTSILDTESFIKDVDTKPFGEINTINSKDSLNDLVYCQIPNTENLYLAMPIEHGDFSKAVKLLFLIFLCSAIIISFLIFIFANKMTNFVAKPLTRMVKIIEGSNGINSIQIPNDLKSSKDEIGVLANTIDTMATNIRNNVDTLNCEIKERRKAQKHLTVLNDDLECRVQERTKALTKVTENLTISEDRFRISMEASNIGLYDSDCINNILVVNDIFLKLINAPEYKQRFLKESDWTQFNGQFDDYIYEDDVLITTQFSEDNLTMVGKDFYTEFRLKEDPTIWLSFVGQSINKDEFGKAKRFIGVLQNITERKKTEVEIKVAKEQAEEANLAKS
ncbi:hypothetical protein [Clostridium vincentii]|uniref:Nitrate/nitrite sensor protein NarQ n=1 Tax=Clostridium vincentii TaxID=52704 RepID=A0A2T0BDU6_9CLOT|nr:hypothetical protein [Clostridium vincentii]PRR82066.1 nitrate/nitrite sensor protein NarQ [Clostridium vincentii]